MELIRKNNLPIGGEMDDYRQWDDMRFIFYVRETDKPDLPWQGLKDLGGYRCVTATGRILDSALIRIGRKKGMEHLKIAFEGGKLTEYDIYIEELLKGSEDAAGVNLRYLDGGMTNKNTHNHVEVSYHVDVVSTALGNLRDYSSKQYNGKRYMLSTGSLSGNSKSVDIVVHNKTTGESRHVPRDGVRDLIPSVITIPCKDISGLLDRIGKEWVGDTIEIRVLVSDGERMDFPITTHRHDTYIAMHGLTHRLIDEIRHFAPGLEDRTNATAMESPTEINNGTINTSFTMMRDCVSIIEDGSGNNVSVGVKHEGAKIDNNEFDRTHMFATDLRTLDGLTRIIKDVDRPEAPYTLYTLKDDKLIELSPLSLLINTTLTKIEVVGDNEVYIMIHGLAEVHRYTAAKNQRDAIIPITLRKNIEVKLNNKWLIAGLDFVILGRSQLYITSTDFRNNGVNDVVIVTHGDTPYMGDGKYGGTLAVHETHNMAEIGGALPTDTILTNSRRYSYGDIVGRGVVPSGVYTYHTYHNTHPDIDVNQGEYTIYSKYHEVALDMIAELPVDDLKDIDLAFFSNSPVLKLHKEALDKIDVSNRNIKIDMMVSRSELSRTADPESMRVYRHLFPNILGI